MRLQDYALGHIVPKTINHRMDCTSFIEEATKRSGGSIHKHASINLELLTYMKEERRDLGIEGVPTAPHERADTQNIVVNTFYGVVNVNFTFLKSCMKAKDSCNQSVMSEGTFQAVCVDPARTCKAPSTRCDFC